MTVEHSSLKNILNRQFRANPNYKIIVFDRLPEQYQQQFSDLKRDPSFYGVLLPCGSQRKSLKAVDQETALLFFTLQEPAPLPAYVGTKFGKQSNQAVIELVLDDVLEMAGDNGENFVSGAAAYDLIYQTNASNPVQDRIAQLSREALQYVQMLDVDDSILLSSRLYFYNTIPVSPNWWYRLGTADKSMSFLEIHAAGKQRAILDRHWVSSKQFNQNDRGWLIWRSRYFESETHGQDPHLSYKLYISPLPDTLKVVWPTIVSILTELRVRSFKIGADIYGLLRPDKIVAYFPSFELLAEAAKRLQQELAGTPAQGVPFTAEIDADGLLSWGMDPHAEQQIHSGWRAKESWRLWITNRLAAALQASKQSRADIPPWQFALERLRLDGVDTDTWTPRQAKWQTKASV